ncbi:MAG: hypothetical protein IJ867_01210 [Clostridia bacterium]|nr:hypothetical protein [Clostridia bacterium]
MWGDIAIAFTIAFLATFMTTPYTIRFAKKIGAVDTPKDERRINKVTMTRLRRFGCYFRVCCFCDLPFDSNDD